MEGVEHGPENRVGAGISPSASLSDLGLRLHPLPEGCGAAPVFVLTISTKRFPKDSHLPKPTPASPEGSADVPSKVFPGLSWQHRSAVGVRTLPAVPRPSDRRVTGKPAAFLPRFRGSPGGSLHFRFAFQRRFRFGPEMS